MSIYDFQIWKSLKNYTPKIVIIKINSSLSPYDNNYIHDGVKYQGTGFYQNLGKDKGYTFVLHTGNMIFIRDDLLDKIGGVQYNDPIENFRRDWIQLI